MDWEVLNDDDFLAWLVEQEPKVQDAIAGAVEVLSHSGPHLGRPLVDTLQGSNLLHMKVLRVRVEERRPYRVLFAFDPLRRAILLVGGGKGGDKRWYQVNIPVAEARYRRHLKMMEGQGDG